LNPAFDLRFRPEKSLFMHSGFHRGSDCGSPIKSGAKKLGSGIKSQSKIPLKMI
jgi:hypothetical protein